MNVNLTSLAKDDLIAIGEWIASVDEAAAQRTVDRILQTIEMFGRFPMLGRPGRIADTREFSVVGLSYLVVYTIASETDIDILSIVHTRRQYPPLP